MKEIKTAENSRRRCANKVIASVNLLTFSWYGPNTTHPKRSYAVNIMAEHTRNLKTCGIAHLSVMIGI